MKTLIHEGRERNWYLIEEWVTEAGLKARVHQCVWNERVSGIAPSLHDFYTGYVEVPKGRVFSEMESEQIDVHGGVTFSPKPIEGAGEENWMGFDMAHIGDEDNQSLSYAKEQCELLAKQIK